METNEITDQLKNLDVEGQVSIHSDSPLGIPQHVRPDPANAQMESALRLSKLLGQKKFHGTYTVDAGTAANAHVFTIAASYDYIQNHLGSVTDTASRYFSTYRFKKILITIELISMGQQQGALDITTSIAPSAFYNRIPDVTSPYVRLKLPRFFIPFGVDSTYTTEIPWNSILSYHPLFPKWPETSPTFTDHHNPFMDHGRVVCRVLNPLRVAEGVTDFVQLRVWTEIIGLEFGAYSPVNGTL